MSSQNTTKTCSKCRDPKSVPEFAKNRAMRDGYANQCKACAKAHYQANAESKRAWQREYRERNPETTRAAVADWRDRNPEKVKEYNRQGRTTAWYRANKERAQETYRQAVARDPERYRMYAREWGRRHAAKRAAYQKVYERVNREAITEKMREYRRANPDRVRQHWMKNHAKRRAAIIGNKVDYAFIFQRDGGICHICSNPVPRSRLHYDHVYPLSKGGSHTEDNIKVSHARCNLKKSAKVI